MAISKVIYGDDTLIDITDSTIDSDNMLQGTVGYDSAGVRTVGSVSVPTNLDDLSDVTITSPSDGQALVYDNGEWVNGDVATTDEKVKQTATNTNANYEVLFSETADNTTRTEGARKYSNLKFNPSTGNLQTTQLNGVTIGNSPKFTDTTYTFATGDSNGQIKVTPDGGSAQNVSVKGLGTAAYTASTDYGVNKILTNEDLNTVKTPGFYVGQSGNTCTNKPDGVAQFGLIVIKTATSNSNYWEQILFQPAGTIQQRTDYNNVWSDWTEVKTTDTDENVKQTDITDTSRRNLAIASDNTTTEQITGINKTMGLSVYTNPVATTSAMGTAVLEVGSNKALNTGSRYKGLADIYNDGYRSRISSMTTANRNMYITDRTGAFATTIDAMSAAAIVTGGSNLVRYPYYHESASSNNVTRVVNTDGSVVFTTTSAGASANTNFYFISGHMQNFVLPAGKYIYRGCPSGGSSTTYYLQVGKVNPVGTVSWVTADYGSGSEFTLTEDTMIHLMFSVRNGYVISDSLTVKPELYYVFQADWSQSDTDARDYIKNKPTLPSASSSNPVDVATAAAVGTSTDYARADHKHKIALATGGSNGTVKIAGTDVPVKGLLSAAYTESTAYAVANKQLTNEDLNTVTDTGFYYAAGGNTCSNKPTGVNNFGLEVIRDAGGAYYTQIIYKVDSTATMTSYRRYCKNGTWSSWVEDKFTDTTYTFTNGTNGFTVTPSGGTAQTVTVTPSISNNVTGSGTSGYLVKFNGANTITNGPQLGSGTTFLKNNGTWDTPDQLKVDTTNPSTGSWYYPTWTDGGGSTARTFNINNGFRYWTLEGKAATTEPVAAAVQGRSVLQLGNGTKAGVNGNKRGEIFLYGEQNGYAVLYMTANATTKKEIYFPNKEGTIALTDDIPGVVSTTADGLAPMVTSTTAYLRGDGTWATPTNNYDRNRYTGYITAGAAITAKNIIVARASDGKYVHLKTNKVAFDIRYPILYANADIASGSTGNNNYDVLAIAIATTQSLTLTAYKPVYIKGTLDGYTFTTLGTAPLTQTVPSSDENYVYMLLGIAYSTTNLYLSVDHRIFTYNGSFRELDSLMNGGSITGSLNVSNQISTQDIYITSPGSINFMGDAKQTVLACTPGNNTVTLPSGSGTLALVGDLPSLDWQGGITISGSSTLTNISSYVNGGYHDLYFVGCLDSTNAIYLNLMIPVADIKLVQSTTSKPRIFRSGYQQSSSVGGEFDIYAVVTSTQGSSVIYDVRVRGGLRKDGTGVSSPSIMMYYR